MSIEYPHPTKFGLSTISRLVILVVGVVLVLVLAWPVMSSLWQSTPSFPAPSKTTTTATVPRCSEVPHGDTPVVCIP